MRRVPVFLVMLLAFTAMATPRMASAQTASAETVRPFNQLRPQRSLARPSTLR